MAGRMYPTVRWGNQSGPAIRMGHFNVFAGFSVAGADTLC